MCGAVADAEVIPTELRGAASSEGIQPDSSSGEIAALNERLSYDESLSELIPQRPGTPLRPRLWTSTLTSYLMLRNTRAWTEGDTPARHTRRSLKVAKSGVEADVEEHCYEEPNPLRFYLPYVLVSVPDSERENGLYVGSRETNAYGNFCQMLRPESRLGACVPRRP